MFFAGRFVNRPKIERSFDQNIVNNKNTVICVTVFLFIISEAMFLQKNCNSEKYALHF